jgi:hypothetical protein
MGDSKNPDRHTDRAKGEHGNVSYGLAKAERQLQKGQPFDDLLQDLYHETLSRWGYSDDELSGARGDFIRLAARQYVITRALDGSQLMAGATGNLESFWMLEKRYGSRRDTAGRSLLKVIEMEEQGEDGTIIEAITEAQGATDGEHNGSD